MSENATAVYGIIDDESLSSPQDWKFIVGVIAAILIVQTYTVGMVILLWYVLKR